MTSETISAGPAASSAMKPKVLSSLILFFFFLSGACGLMYQIVWLRVLSLVFGNTTYATSAVLSGYMAGLGLGALYFGKWIDRQKFANPIRVYGIMEGGVGLYALITPFLWNLIDRMNVIFYQSFHPSFLQFSLFKFAVSFALLFVPTFLMGGTLPILSKFYVTHKEQVAHKVGILYALNTAGAVLGVVFSSFFCLYYLGVWQTTVLTAVLNILIFAVCLFWIKGSNQAAEISQPVNKPFPPNAAFGSGYSTSLLVLFGISGGVSMMYEIGWTRALAIVLGSSIYAFAVMLSTFLLGIAIGSFIFSWVVKRMKIDLSVFSILQAATAFFGFIGLNQFDEMPYRFVQLYQWSKNSAVLIEFGRFGLCALVMLGPTICIGAMFACFIHLYHQEEHLGDDIGTAYFANTVGTIFGAALTGFLIIPVLGIYKTLMAAAGINAGIGVITFLMNFPQRQLKRTVVFATVLLVAGVGASSAHPWNRSVMTSGAVVRPNMHTAPSREDFIRSLETRHNLFYKEGTSATVSVNQVRDIISLAVNGKTDASNGTDSFNQFLLGHLPMLLNPSAKQVLTIGLGSGSTLAAVASYAVQKIDCVELEAAVVGGARFFSDLNRNVLNDPRVRIIINDGRNYLKISPTQYDVIISEPSNPWMAGVANLFSYEHYQTMKTRLTKGGVVCQWLHAYSMSDQDLRMIVRTFTQSFAHTSLWTSNYPDLLLIGSNDPVEFDFNKVQEEFKRPEIRQDFVPYDIKTAEAIMGMFWLSDSELRRFSAGARINSDNRPYLEFSAPRHLYDDTVSSNYHLINAFALQNYPTILNLEPPIASNVKFHLEVARSNFYRKNYGKAQTELIMLKALDPTGAGSLQISGMLQYEMNNNNEAAESDLKASLSQNPDLAETHFYLGLLYQRKKQINQAVFSFYEAARLEPGNTKYLLALGDALIEARAYQLAGYAFDQALQSTSMKFDLLVRKAAVMARTATAAEKMLFTEQLVESYPRHVAFYEMLGQVYQESNMTEKAERVYRDMIREFPLEASGYLQLGILFGKRGAIGKAREQLRQAVRYDKTLLKNSEIKKALEQKGA